MKKYFSLFTFFFLAFFNLSAAAEGVARSLDFTNYADGSYYTTLADIDAGRVEAVDGLQGLFGTKEFNPSKDPNLIRAIMAGLFTRKAFIKLDDAQFRTVVSGRLPFFSTSFGFSLIHGWMLNKFSESTTPCYILEPFSFDNLFWGMINAIRVSDATKALIRRAWWSARETITADIWSYYSNMLSLGYAIEQAGTTKGTLGSMADIIYRSYVDLEFCHKTTAEFRAATAAKINAYLAARGVIEPTDNPLELFSDIMAWVLAHHINLSGSILPAGAPGRNFNVTKFVNCVIDRAFTLYEGYAGNPTKDTTLAQIKSADINASGLQFGQALQTYLYALLRSIHGIVNEKNQFNELIFATVKEAIGKAKKAQVATPSLVILAPVEIAAFGAPNPPVRLTGLPLSPKKDSPSMLRQAGLQSDQTFLGELGVYFTPVIWVDGDLASLNKFELADILKTFESYLKVKETLVRGDVDADKGAYCGTFGKRTYLAQIRAWRYKLLSMNSINEDATAVNAARFFIVSEQGRERIRKSMGDKKPN